MNKKIIIPAILLGLVTTGAVVWKTGIASAAFGGSDEKRDEMASELAAKLNVSTDQVKTAMDQIRQEHQAERKAEVSSKLDQAISDGVITLEQKELLLQKMDENRAEKKSERQGGRAEMDQWFKDNGIDSEKIHSYIGNGQGRNRGN